VLQRNDVPLALVVFGRDIALHGKFKPVLGSVIDNLIHGLADQLS
jgi:hypothetical protein